MSYPIAALRMDRGPCDRTGQIHEQLQKEIDWTRLGMPSNPTLFDFLEDSRWNLTGAASQNAYTSLSVCVDNWGFFEKEIQLPDVVSSFEAGKGECPLKLQSKYGLNMYRFMVTDGLQHDALNGKHVLEVGSGRGKGAAYLAKTFGPAKYIGVDLNEARVESASKLWGATPNLKFEVGSASQLPIQNSSMDFVLNVESSFHYPDFGKFLSEVHRVLKPGGTFLWTAPLLTRGDTVANKEDQFTASGFRLEKSIDITQNVVESRWNLLQKSDAQEFAIICAGLYDNSFLWPWLALPGTLFYKAMDTRAVPYVRFIAKKPL
jgi:SAM-dependent methyltransferase